MSAKTEFNIASYPTARFFMDGKRYANKHGARDLGAICRELDIKLRGVLFTPESQIDGLIKKNDDGKFEIIVGVEEGKEKVRYITGHELGHYFSWSDKKCSFDPLERHQILADSSKLVGTHPKADIPLDDNTLRLEAEADFIGSHILMPEDFIRRYIEKGKSVEEMAQIFVVPRSAVVARLRNVWADAG